LGQTSCFRVISSDWQSALSLDYDIYRRVDWQAVWGSQSVLLGRGTTGIAWSLTLSVVALGVIGVATSLLSGRGLVYSSTRQVVVGALAGQLPT